MRQAIEKASLNQRDSDFYTEVFGCTLAQNGEIPTTAEYISTVVDYMKN